MNYPESMVKSVRNSIDNLVIESDGAGKWKSNGSYLMDDIADIMANVLGQPINIEATKIKRDRQVAEMIAQYRKNWQPPSDEALAEMRAEFGAGEVVVDVLSGRRIQL